MTISKNIAIVGGGWAGMAAAVAATQAGHHATVFEASHALGGRARVVSGSHGSTLPDGTPVSLDNGQHILIGAYSETLKLMQTVGVNLENALLRMPLTMQFPDQTGLKLPDWPAPWLVGLDAAWGIATTKGWTLGDKLALLRAASNWQRGGFTCSQHLSVLQLCQKSNPAITPRIMSELIEPLCLSALNTPMADASAQVFLRVLQDAMFSPNTEVKVKIDEKTSKSIIFGSANLLIPKRDLSNLFPHPAAAWLVKHGGKVLLGERVESMDYSKTGWQISATTVKQSFDAVILAGSPSNMALAGVNIAYAATNFIAKELEHLLRREVQDWQNSVNALRYEAIATVYAYSKGAKLSQPMLALKSDTGTDAQNPAQFVFDRGQLGGETGLLAFVISAAKGDRLDLQNHVIEQGKSQLNLPDLHPIQTIIEKRATFACTPDLKRPSNQIAPGLLVCGDYVAGPYPATLEGAVRSALQAVDIL
jgi:squalene-associated FAD-dependent desaturase